MLWFGSGGRGTLVGVVDVGTSKIVCLAVEMRQAARNRAKNSANGEAAELQCLGIGHRQSAGMRGGVVVEPLALETAVRDAVAAAERAARQELHEVFVSLSCGRLASQTFAAKAEASSGSVSRTDIDRLYQGAVSYAERDGRTLIHINRRGYRLDGAPCGDDPRGMAAREIAADIHAVTADAGPVTNLMHVIEAAHLDVKGLVAAPYASGLAVTTAQERALGVTVVDFGAGTTGIAIFADGQFVHGEILATGGHHLTFEIAKKFQAPLAEAERIKALYGSMVNAHSGVSERFSYALAGVADSETGGASGSGSRAELFEVVEPRMAALIGLVDERRRAAGAARLPVVLTGGGSQLVGLAGAVASLTGADVRLGRTIGLPGMAAGSDQPALAAGVGLARAAAEGSRMDLSGPVPGGYFASVGRWLAGR